RTAQENILRLEGNATMWLEPMRKWINEASMLDKIAQSKDFPAKKSSLQKIFGSNLHLVAREARGTAKPHWFSLVGGTEMNYPTLKGGVSWLRNPFKQGQLASV
ncbi:MAG: hypothetical protein WA021_04520, partial [Minisyncoccia bacterium]